MMSISLMDKAVRTASRMLNLFDLSGFPGAEVVRIRRTQVVVAYCSLHVVITAYPEDCLYQECWESSRWRPFRVMSFFGPDPDKEWLGTGAKCSGKITARGVQRVVRRHLKRVGPMAMLAAVPMESESTAP